MNPYLILPAIRSQKSEENFSVLSFLHEVRYILEERIELNIQIILSILSTLHFNWWQFRIQSFLWYRRTRYRPITSNHWLIRCRIWKLSWQDRYNNQKELVKMVNKLPGLLMGEINVSTRRFLQFFLNNKQSRLLAHSSLFFLCFVLIAAGILRPTAKSNAAIPLAVEEESGQYRYVSPLVSGHEPSDFNALINDGYLSENNTVNTAISTFLPNGIQTYALKSGDTLESIASTYGTTVRTIRWINQIKNSRNMPEKVMVFQGTGFVHEVAEGENLESVLAKYAKYGVKREDLISKNQLIEPVRIASGQRLVIPADDLQVPLLTDPPLPAPKKSLAKGQTWNGPVGDIGSGQFIWPTTGIITRGCREHGPRDCALDIASRALPPVYASDSGTVVYAGWDSSGYGNRIDIDHGNGFVTRYAHNNRIYVGVGQQVVRGQVIAQMGNTGNSTGPHLHFMIILRGVPQDPLLYL